MEKFILAMILTARMAIYQYLPLLICFVFLENTETGKDIPIIFELVLLLLASAWAPLFMIVSSLAFDNDYSWFSLDRVEQEKD